MWGAENKHLIGDLMGKYPRVRTLRGLHAKWKQPEPVQELRAATLNDLRKVERLRALRDVLPIFECDHKGHRMTDHRHLET